MSWGGGGETGGGAKAIYTLPARATRGEGRESCSEARAARAAPVSDPATTTDSHPVYSVCHSPRGQRPRLQTLANPASVSAALRRRKPSRLIPKVLSVGSFIVQERVVVVAVNSRRERDARRLETLIDCYHSVALFVGCFSL